MRSWLVSALVLLAALPGLAAELVPFQLHNPANGQQAQFMVELATTFEQRKQGLMYRTELPAGQGMLFIWPEAKPRAMWMKNTYLPLDMVFMADGQVVAVASNTTPLSHKLIMPGEPVDTVLELNAGEAAAAGLSAGWQSLPFAPSDPADAARSVGRAVADD